MHRLAAPQADLRGGSLLAAALLLLAAFTLMARLGSDPPIQDAADAGRAAGAAQSLFVPNRGQTDAQVRYYTTGADSSVYFTDRKAVLSLTRGDRGAALHMRFDGANPEATLEAHRRTHARMSYLTGDRARSRSDLPTYREVVYRDLWPGIDAAFTINASGLKYEFRLAPGADASDIRLSYAGADAVSLAKSGDLRVRTPLGTVTDARPHSYQRIAGRMVPVASGYGLAGANGIRLRVGAHDPRRPLVIDPEVSYLTLLGGSADDRAFGVAVDGTGAAYVTGNTSSPDFPTTPGAFSRSKGAEEDTFVTKLNPHGSGVVWSTLIGGSTGTHGYATDVGESIAVDVQGNAYVTGITYSTDFPTTAGAFDRSFNGGYEDAYVAKLNPDGSRLLYSTFLGGAQFDVAHGIEVDGGGHAFIGGYTDSPEYPTTPGAYDGVINSDGSGTSVVFGFFSSPRRRIT